MIIERASSQQLLGIFVCLLLALAANLASIPWWVAAIVAICGLIRLGMARAGRAKLPRGVLLTLAALAIALLFLRFHAFNGMLAGTALLALMAGLKLLETRTKHDLYIITMIIYFLSLSALLEGDS